MQTQVQKQIQAYFVEAKWFNQEYTPTFDGYMSKALVSYGYSMLTTTSFVGMGDIATKEAFDWAFSHPNMVRTSCIICRLMDDIVSHEVLIIQSFMLLHGVLYSICT